MITKKLGIGLIVLLSGIMTFLNFPFGSKNLTEPFYIWIFQIGTHDLGTFLTFFGTPFLSLGYPNFLYTWGISFMLNFTLTYLVFKVLKIDV